MSKINGFSVMWNNYPMGEMGQVLNEIFGENSKKTSASTRNWVFSVVNNSCTIRLSHALNSTTHLVRPIGSVEMITGIKGKYIIKVTEMIKYLKLRYGQPQVNAFGNEEKMKAAVKDKKGIICFNGKLGGAMGHFDLWNGTSARYSDYFDMVPNVLLWEVSE